MKGKNGTTSFLPERRKGGKVRFSEEVTYIPNKERMCLTKDQATQIYEEVEKNGWQHWTKLPQKRSLGREIKKDFLGSMLIFWLINGIKDEWKPGISNLDQKYTRRIIKMPEISISKS